MEIEEQRHGAVTVLRPRGPLVQTDADQFRKRAAEVMAKSLGRFVIDASGIAYTDSRGLEVLVEVSEELAQGGQVLRLCGAAETLREVFDLTEISGLFEHYADVSTAVRSFL